MAFASVFVAAATVALAILLGFVRPDLTSVDSIRSLMFWVTVACGTAGVIGFALGSDRMASVFGFIWGTEDPSERPQILVTASLIAIACVLIAYFALA